VKETFVPWAMLPFAGAIEIDLRLLAFTVRDVLAEVDSNAASMLVVPRLLAVARPLTVIVAIELFWELHLTTLVTSCEVPSEKVAVAVNCWLTSSARLAFMGAMAREVAVAEVTVREVIPEIDPEVALMVTLPAETPCASPFVGEVLLTVATEAFEELQFTLAVMFCMLLSVKVPVAVNCRAVSRAMLALAGVTAIETRAGAIVTWEEPLMEFMVAVMDTVPLDFAVNMPLADIVAMLVLDELQLTEFVKSFFVWSL
jgi:hypothetical protein